MPTLEPFADVPPNTPDYRDLRMVADWASAIRGDPLYFTYGNDTGRMSLAQFPDGQPPLFTPPNATRPVVAQVEFAVEGVAEPLRVDGHAYSALLWSESAVEKFLLPCFASADADDAAHFLDRLTRAWYGYPERMVQVCALAYRYGTHAAEGPLSLDASVELVCLERAGGGSGTLRLMGLDEFERRYPSGAARGGSRYGDEDAAGMPDPHAGWAVARVDSIVAREAAEFVSGMRGRHVWFTFDGGVLTPWVCPTEAPGTAPAGTVMAQGVAMRVRPDRPAPRSVKVRLQTGHANPVVEPDDDVTRAPDSIFWTDGAVEKLMLPYYASVKGRASPVINLVLMGKWDGRIPPMSNDLEAAVSALPSYFPLAAGPAANMVAAADDDPTSTSTVYAITHLPRSEYVMDPGVTGGSGSPALEHRTGVLTFDGASFALHPLFRGA
jgi:hypothetical protein